jgi:hypothetical protein
MAESLVSILCRAEWIGNWTNTYGIVERIGPLCRANERRRNAEDLWLE